MSWDVRIRKIDFVKPVENSDQLDVCFLGGWPCVTKRGDFVRGDLAAYIPTDSLVPQDLLRTMGLEGKLAGREKNRVKAIKLRKQLSIGLLHKMPGVPEGTDVSATLGITKYEEPIPASLAGIARKHPRGWMKYDIENINNTSEWFSEVDDVCIMEKLHGSNMAVSLIDEVFEVHSRSITLEESSSNSYWIAARRLNLEEKIRKLSEVCGKHFDIWMYGELLPIQDLKYGQSDLTMYLFDIRMIDKNDINIDTFENPSWTKDVAAAYNIPHAPILYGGKFSMDKVLELTSGQETVSGKSLHIREGVVVKCVPDRKDHRDGRRIVKSINPDYLLRKEGSELH